ncbi:Uncharacterized conserved protein YeaO, DUF488 family [Lutimaribacter pacificus]|uniref:Uncharacterized conserved protein YeaO, DUF488 family n=1 Tax=Lutimaribacter pacificus TaxID=391948 RepID=A0A1H0NS95_9RHOB|nr:DUF488 family protein [Lutimaribacter pacificus]SDO95345.1 Uncharacterized conserved protein YeaO, DUF488 family [Lutimaribacter pacificus]SHK95961.1 Uncharacterized conserved protein YeaO, DUF488 family [Lutimaribacter pacificus]
MPPARPPIPDAPGKRIRVKRIYRAARLSDGKRILVDRLWPRGVAKDRARLFQWHKEIAPSDELRHWFHGDPDQWQAFTMRYQAELAAHDDLVRELAGYAREGVVTLLYASKNEAHNNAIVLRDYLRQWLEREGQT